MPKKNELPAAELNTRLDHLEAMSRFDISPTEAAAVLGCDPGALTVAAKTGNLGLPYFFAGSHLRLSRLAVLAFCGRTPMQTECKGLPWSS